MPDRQAGTVAVACFFSLSQEEAEQCSQKLELLSFGC